MKNFDITENEIRRIFGDVTISEYVQCSDLFKKIDSMHGKQQERAKNKRR